MALGWKTGGRRKSLGRLLNTSLTFALVLVIWETAVRLLSLPRYILPGPIHIAYDFFEQWQRILVQAVFTSQVILAGYAVAVLVSIPLALIIAYSPFIETTVYPLMVVFQIIPKIAVAPLFIVWFGFGFAPKMMLVFLLSFFPIVVAAIAGFKSADPEIMDLARSTGANQWMMFRKIRLPQALPHIFTGLKVGAAMSATAAVVAEFVGSDKGLGYLLLDYNGNIETGKVFAVVFLLSLIGIIVYYSVELAERLAIPWHVSQKVEQGDVKLF